MKYIFMILTVILFFENTNFAQEITESEKEQIISELDSTNFWVRRGALEKIKEYNITEAIPKLLENIWKENLPSMKYSYLETLFKLKYSTFNLFAHEFIDSVDNFNFEFSSDLPLTYKMYATGLLIRNGDYSTINYLFEAIKQDTSNEHTVFYILPLKEIAKNLPEYKDSAMAELLRIATMETKDELKVSYKFYALYELKDIEGSNIINLSKELLSKNETEFSIKMLTLKILDENNYSDFEELLKQRIESDTSRLFKLALLIKLYKKFKNPSTLYFMKSYYKKENDDRVKKRLQIEIALLKAKEPDSTITSSTMLDTLTSYTNQCYGYEWLKDETYKTELLNKLTNAKSKLTAGDSIGCRTEVAAFQNSVNQVYQDSAGSYTKYVSEEGYKFLYYYAGYILDRLPEETFPPNDIDARVKVKKEK